MVEKIRLRTGHSFVHLDSGISVVGSLTYGLALGLKDPKADMLVLNRLLDGTRSFDEAVADFSRETCISESTARNLLNKLRDKGHLEDVALQTNLSAEEQERYSRSAEYFSWINNKNDLAHWRAQELISDTSVSILGLGGIGSTIAMHLTAAGVREIYIVDFDKVELSNLNRQYIYSTHNVGEYKVEAAERFLSQLNPHVTVIPEVKKLSKPEDIVPYFKRSDILFRSADRPDEMPFWVSDAALLTRKPWIECSYNGPVINVCTFVPGKTGCYRCLRQHEKNRLESSGQSQIYSDHVPDFNAVLGPIASIAGGLAAYEGMRLITDSNPNSVGRALHQNMFDYSMSYVIDVPVSCMHEVGGEQRG